MGGDMKTSIIKLLQIKLDQYRSSITTRYQDCRKAALNEQSGVTMIEYVLIAAIVVGIIIVLFTTFGQTMTTAWQAVETAIQSPPAP